MLTIYFIGLFIGLTMTFRAAEQVEDYRKKRVFLGMLIASFLWFLFVVLVVYKYCRKNRNSTLT